MKRVYALLKIISQSSQKRRMMSISRHRPAPWLNGEVYAFARENRQLIKKFVFIVP
jgi:hypothetical protein